MPDYDSLTDEQLVAEVTRRKPGFVANKQWFWKRLGRAWLLAYLRAMDAEKEASGE